MVFILADIPAAMRQEGWPIGDGRIRLRIDAIGTYLRDTCDFNGDQMPGSRGAAGLRRVAVLAPDVPVVRETARERRGQAFWSVGSGSFRDWRRQYGRGGDFTIYSGIGRRRLLRPVDVELAA